MLEIDAQTALESLAVMSRQQPKTNKREASWSHLTLIKIIIRKLQLTVSNKSYVKLRV